MLIIHATDGSKHTTDGRTWGEVSRRGGYSAGSWEVGPRELPSLARAAREMADRARPKRGQIADAAATAAADDYAKLADFLEGLGRGEGVVVRPVERRVEAPRPTTEQPVRLRECATGRTVEVGERWYRELVRALPNGKPLLDSHVGKREVRRTLEQDPARWGADGARLLAFLSDPRVGRVDVEVPAWA